MRDYKVVKIMLMVLFVLIHSTMVNADIRSELYIIESINNKKATCCETDYDFYVYIYNATDLPWNIDYEYASEKYGENSYYIKSVLDNYFSKKFLILDNSTDFENLTIDKREAQLEYLRYISNNINNQIASEISIISGVYRPDIDGLNYAQRLDIYTRLIKTKDSIDLQKMLFHDSEKELARNFIEQIQRHNGE
ncbi:hypothetical protein RJ45_20480 [Photobacterium gaetbulicola]|uniref:Uncharacterized protein n=1 Tax=Photobacterium gaetbulicola TaxID=1295392 RepID=A0A0B9GAI4_9GAMM|nr:hypothetical protein [Photobacterium gaetbulicola]KHT61910.1 hypothetical protein RJ45_20480 [Photobacterium gaetbulicola]